MKNSKQYIIVGNRGSYYHEGYWTGSKFTQDINKAKIFGKSINKDLIELDLVREKYSHAYPMLINKQLL